MENFYGFVVRNVTLKKEKNKVIEEVAKELNSQLTIFDFNISEDNRTYAIAFEKPQKTQYIESLFPQTYIIPIPDYEKRVSRNDTIYITNIPTEFEDLTSMQKLIQTFGDVVGSIVHAKAFCFLKMKTDFQATCLARFLPEILFQTGKFDIYLNSNDMPIIHISPISSDFTEEEFLELIKGEAPVVKSYYQPGPNADFYSLNVLMRNNDEAYATIDALNYSKIGDTDIILTHFKKREDIEEMKKWELRVSGLKPNITLLELNQFFSKYGRVFSISLMKQPFFARVTFENEEDARSVYNEFATTESQMNVSYSSQKSYLTIFVQNFPFYYKHDQIKEIFPNAVGIQINPNKFDRKLPPSVVLSFASEKEGEEALQKGNATYVRDLRLFCLPFIQKDRQPFEKVGIKANPESTIYISNLKYIVTYEDIVELCSQFGKLERVTLLKKKGRRDAAAVVQFTDKKAAEKAIEDISEFEMDGLRPEASFYVDPEVKKHEEILRARELAKGIKSGPISQELKKQEEEKQHEDDDDDDDA